MSRNFGIQSGRPALGGASDRPSASLSDYMPSDSILISSGSPLEKGHVFDAADDIIASVRLVALMLLIGAVIGAIVFACIMFIE